jgi:hypothetical protein
MWEPYGNHLSVSQGSDRINPRNETLLEFSGAQLGKDISEGIARLQNNPVSTEFLHFSLFSWSLCDRPFDIHFSHSI